MSTSGGGSAAGDLGIAGIHGAVPIGSGGSSRVYRATQGQLDRVVAVKILIGAQEAERKQFDRESKALGRLASHPGIVTVHDAGFTQAGEPYLVLQYCSGGSLSDLVTDQVMPWQRAVAYLAPVASTLADAHDQGFIHRDLKPGNILLDDQGRPLIADFGLAHALGASASMAQVSRAGFTPGYVPPETISGERATTAGDVYSLGGTLYSLLTGLVPFVDTDSTLNIVALAKRIVEDPVPDLRPHGVPEPVCALIEACMSKDPAQRPSAHELAQHLTALGSGGAGGAADASGLGDTTIHLSPEVLDRPIAPAAPGAAPSGSAADEADPVAMPQPVSYEPAPTFIPGAPRAESPTDDSSAESGDGTKRRRGLVVALAALVSALIIGAGAYFVLQSGSGDSAAEFVVSQAEPARPVFEPKSAGGTDPFFPIDAQVAAFERDVNDAGSGDSAGGGTDGFEVSDADIESGLFGGTVENTCDPERLIEFLYDNPDKGEAWARVQGIEFNQIEDYIRSLDIRILAEPAVVLNHGFDEQTQTAYPVEATLDAGTAVLVDADGDIRARCYCGNPVTPKPAEFRPPRCVVVPDLMFSTAGGGERRSGVPGRVELTGRVATSGAQSWSEVAWGDDHAEAGWTPDTNLSSSGCVSDIAPDERCAAVGTPVWATASDLVQVGVLGGDIETAAGADTVRATVRPVGGSSGALTENGFVLVHFTQAAPAVADSGWVRTSDLDRGDCSPPPVCISTDDAVTDRAGGYTVRPGGRYRVALTGHFAPGEPSSAQVQFIDGGVGWVSSTYVPVADSECEPVPGRYACVAGRHAVWPTAEATDPLAVVGTVAAAIVIVTDDAAVNGRLPVTLSASGPSGWVDEAAFAPPKRCAAQRVCATVSASAWSEFSDQGSALDGTPGEAVLDLYRIVATHPDNEADLSLVGIQGQRGWVDSNKIELAPDGCDGFDDGVGPVKPIVEPDPTATRAPSSTPTPGPTATSAPDPTPTPRPTATPQPEPTPTSPPRATPTPQPEPTPTCSDADGDGICDDADNCQQVANPDQADADGDGLGDACDSCTDADLDLHCAETDDTCPNHYDPGLTDTDNDGKGDVCDPCPSDPEVSTPGKVCAPVVLGCSPGSYVGLPKQSAITAADANHCQFRIVREDDQHFIITHDYVPHRLNFEIDLGIVTRVSLG